MKKCRLCKEEKETSAFGYHSSTKDKLRHECKLCRKKESAAKKEADPDVYRNIDYKRRYGISVDDYNEMYTAQKGCCAICNRHSSFSKNERLVVDHNHSTGEVRGLLCSYCNSALGMLQDSKSVVLSAYQYLEERGSYGIS
jgi:hypothetical protein